MSFWIVSETGVCGNPVDVPLYFTECTNLTRLWSLLRGPQGGSQYDNVKVFFHYSILLNLPGRQVHLQKVEYDGKVFCNEFQKAFMYTIFITSVLGLLVF